MKRIKDNYEGGVCPDCGLDIPPNAVEGEECSECGHVFWDASDDPDHFEEDLGDGDFDDELGDITSEFNFNNED